MAAFFYEGCLITVDNHLYWIEPLSSQYGDPCNRISPQFILYVLDPYPVSKEGDSGIQPGLVSHPENGYLAIITSHLDDRKLCAHDLPMEDFWLSRGRGG